MRRRILLAIIGVAAAAVLALAVPLGLGAARLYRDDELLSLERDATAAARGFDANAPPGDPVEFASSAADLAAYGRNRHLLGGAGPKAADAIVQQAIRSGRVVDSEQGGRLVVAVPILAGERIAGAIRASRSTDELSERIFRMRLTIAGVAALIIALSAAAALALTRRLVRPLAALARAAAAIEAGRAAVRSPRSGIPELDTVAETLDDSAARLGAAVVREREFSADASHQLKTPLAALRLALESRQLLGEEMEEPLRQVDRLEATIRALLSAARDQDSSPEPFSLPELLEELRRDRAGTLAAQGRRLEVIAPAELPGALASQGAAREILAVLVDNATRHGAGTITVEARGLDRSLAIDVADQGPGVVEPATVFARRSGGGHGIGLALARSLAEADGGRLDLVDARAGATTFTLLLRAESKPDDP